MQKISHSLTEIRQIDELARRHSPIHDLHPLAKLLATAVFFLAVLSFNRLEVLNLLPFLAYPVLAAVLAGIPGRLLVRRVLSVEPFILAVGLINLFFDQEKIPLGSGVISSGWLALVSLLLKSVLVLSASLILLMTTGIEKLDLALQRLHLPRLFCLQLLLTYRYIQVLAEEWARMIRSFRLRAPGQRGIHPRYFGALAGQLLLRTMDRARRIDQAMRLRGFSGVFHAGPQPRMRAADYLFLLGIAGGSLALRLFSLPELLGRFLT
jgi:cobalt/nickel transport system permease protein